MNSHHPQTVLMDQHTEAKPLRLQIASQVPPAATPSEASGPASGTFPPKATVYIGIDNGTTGAMAALYPAGKVVCRPVVVMCLGHEKLLDVQGNIEALRALIDGNQTVLVVFEQAQIAPMFGAKNNYTNGKNNEFWRVLLSVEKIPFCWVNPKTWQKAIFHGIRGTDTKVMAELVRRQRFPDLDLRAYNASQRGGINDAIGIALWARQTLL